MVETRDHRLLKAFVAVAGHSMHDVDIVELFQTFVDVSVDLFAADAAGILLANADQELEVIASSSERSNLIGLLQLQAGEGPCVEAFTTGTVVSVADPDEMHRRWPSFAAESAASGYASVHAIPLRYRTTTLGSLNLFREAVGRLDADDALAAEALADVATISILHQRNADHAVTIQRQLQHALDSRVVIEQAKGYLAQALHVDMDSAFRTLRHHARRTQSPLTDVAHAVVAGTLRMTAPA